MSEAEKVVEEAGNKVDTLKAEVKEAHSTIDSTTTTINELTEELADKNTEAESYKAMQKVLALVLSNGSATDISSITNADLQAQLKSLGQEVDKLNAIKAELTTATDDYQTKYNAYLDAKAELVEAQAQYNDAMKALNDYLAKQEKENQKEESTNNTSSNAKVTTTSSSNTSKEEKTNGVHTGVESNVIGSMTMLGLASLGLLGAKRRKK